MDFLNTLANSAVTVALVTGIMTLIMKRMERKWSNEDKSSEIQQSIKTLSSEFHEDRAKRYRNEILRFADEIRMGWKHSKDSFENVMIAITEYNEYCDKHPSFKNEITVLSQEIIRSNFKSRMDNNDFV